MALSKQDLSIALGTGIDTKTDPKGLPPGKLLVCENSNIDQKTGSSYRRFGNKSLQLDTFGRGVSGSLYSPSISGVQKITTLNGELVAITNKALFGYSEEKEKWAWKGYIGNAIAETTSVMRGAQDGIASDTKVLNGYLVVATIGLRKPEYQNQIIFTVMDEQTKKVINELSISCSVGTSTSFPYQVRCVTRGKRIYAYFNSLSSTQSTLRVIYVDTDSPAEIINTGVVTTGDCGAFDVCEVGTDQAIVALATAASSFDVRVSYIKPDGTFGGVSDGLPANEVTVVSGYGVGLFASSVSIAARTGTANDGIYVTYASKSLSATTVQVAVYSLALSSTATRSVTLGTYLVIGIVSVCSSDAFYFVPSCIFQDTPQQFVAIPFVLSLVNVITLYAAGINGSCYSKPFIYNQDLHIISTNTSFGSEQKSYFLMRVDSIAVATPLGGLGYGTPQKAFLPICQMLVNEGINDSYYLNYGNSVALGSDGNFVVSLQRSYAVVSASNNEIRSAHLTTATTIKIDSPDGYQVIEKENALFISAGLLFVYDGNYVFENGFLVYPVIVSAVEAGTGVVTPGLHVYQTTYEWTDRTGNKHISAPSLNKSLTVAGTPFVNVLSRTTAYTYKLTSAYFPSILGYGVALYRTPVNSTVKYRITPQSPEPSINNWPDLTAVKLTKDDVSDSTAITREIIYTNGGVIENVASGSSSSIEDYQGRILLSGREDGNTILFSKQKRPTLAYQFNPDLLFTVRESQSRVRAAKVLDDKVILFKDTSIYVQAGQGPSDTGENSDYLQNPQRISANVGCPYPRSIVRYNDGIIFKSLDGFYKLSRALELTPIGDPVSLFNSLDVRDGVLIDDRSEIRWVHSDGVCLIYDYFQDQWYTHTNHEAVSACVWKNLFVMAKADGEIWVEDKSTHLDAGAPFSRRLVTPWFAMAGLQHAERIYRVLLLGEMLSPHKLKVYISYDYEPARRELLTFDSIAELGNVSLPKDAFYTVPPTYTNEDRTYDIEMRPAIQKCESFRLEIYDEPLESAPGVYYTGGCAVWTSLTMTIGAKRSTLRPSSSRRGVPT